MLSWQHTSLGHTGLLDWYHRLACPTYFDFSCLLVREKVCINNLTEDSVLVSSQGLLGDVPYIHRGAPVCDIHTHIHMYVYMYSSTVSHESTSHLVCFRQLIKYRRCTKELACMMHAECMIKPSPDGMGIQTQQAHCHAWTYMDIRYHRNHTKLQIQIAGLELLNMCQSSSEWETRHICMYIFIYTHSYVQKKCQASQSPVSGNLGHASGVRQFRSCFRC